MMEVKKEEITTTKVSKKSHHKRRKKESAPEKKKQEGVSTSLPEGIEIEYTIEKPEDIEPELAQAFDRLSKLKPDQSSSSYPLSSSTNENVENIASSILDSLLTDDDNNGLLLLSESKKEMKKKNRPTVSELKQVVSRPAVVEVHDVASPDPELLLLLKCKRMSVPVPRHWSSSTKFLSGKRQSDKKPYQLPEYIAQTGIGKLREASDDTNDSLQKRQRERARPKLGRIDIDYHVLHDAFFKYQTKPRLTKHGELYYEGKEHEKDFSKCIPGAISDELRIALGMPTIEQDGPAAASIHPPPWLFNMQRIGPPPSYPSFSFPGVNAPLPAGAQYGMSGNGWGKPPLDQYGRGLYGDVLGASVTEKPEEKVKLWGEIQVTEEEEEGGDAKRTKYVEEEEEEEEEEQEVAEESSKRESEKTSLSTISQPSPQKVTEIKSLVPEQVVDLRKKPLTAHKVLEKQSVSVSSSNQLFGASHKYVNEPVAVAITPDAIKADGEIDQAELDKLLNEERRRTQSAPGLAPGAGKVDLSEFEHPALKKAAVKDGTKKEKDKKKDKFKF